MKDEVNLQTCRELGVDCIRRWTGGGAVYHDPKGEITYSLIAPASSFPKNIIRSYEVICGWIVNGLKTLGIDAEFSPVNDIIVKGKKNLRQRPDPKRWCPSPARDDTLRPRSCHNVRSIECQQAEDHR